MNTTAVYIELIIIGMETLSWISLLLYRFIGIDSLKNVDTTSVIFLIIALAASYVTGIITDQIADNIYSKYEKSIRAKKGLKSKTTMLVWTTEKRNEFFFYSRTKIRIIRSTAINIIPLTITLIVLFATSQSSYKIAICIITCLLIGASLYFYIRHLLFLMIDNFYSKAKLLEE